MPYQNDIAALDRAVAHATAWLAGLETRSVASTVARATILSRIPAGMPATGMCATDVIDELVAIADGGLLGSASGRFYAWVIGGGLPSTIGADLLTTVWDQNAAPAGMWSRMACSAPRAFACCRAWSDTGPPIAHSGCLASARATSCIDDDQRELSGAGERGARHS